MKFKVGDRVKVVIDMSWSQEPKIEGTVGTIVSIIDDVPIGNWYEVALDNYQTEEGKGIVAPNWAMFEDMLEKVA